jgi:hypothetical protein
MKPAFVDQLRRRIGRFENYLRTSSNILCIRLQENNEYRIPYYKSDERLELDRFISLVKSKYDTSSLRIIWINKDEEGWNADKTILSVKVDTLNFTTAESSAVIEKALKPHLIS